MKKIPLTQGQFAIVDDEDYPRLSKFKWFAVWIRARQAFVARHYSHIRRTRHGTWTSISIAMHHEIMGRKLQSEIDHRNGDPLDNRKDNLRWATRSQNNANQRLRVDNRLGFKGVQKVNRRFRARIKTQDRKWHLGYFDTAIEAAHAYNKAAQKHFGEFARLNKIEKEN